MDRIFISIYRFLKDRRYLTYSLIGLTSALFLVFGLQVEFEEDISSLMPETEDNSESSLAFKELRIKDKVFVQISCNDDNNDIQTLAAHCDEFVQMVMSADEEGSYINDILYRLDDDLLFMGMDYALAHLPSFIDEDCYMDFDSLTAPSALRPRMAANYEMLMADEDGRITQAICQDPAGLLSAVIPQKDNNGGMRVMDSHFFSPDSTTVLAFITPSFKSEDSKAGNGMVKMIENAINEFETVHPDVEILFHGLPVQSVFNSRQIKKDLLFTLGLSLLGICIIIGIAFRNKSTLPLLFAPVAWGTFFALTCIYFIQGTISLMSIGLEAIVLGVALSYSLHVITHYKYLSEPEKILRDQCTPLLLGCITTVGAFIGLLFTGSELLKDFGLIASLTILGTVFFSLVFTPQFLRPHRNRKSRKAFIILDRVNSYPYDSKKWLRGLVAVCCAVCLCFSGKVGFESDLRSIGYNEPKVQKSRESFSEKISGGNANIYYASAAESLDSAVVLSGKLAEVLDRLETEGKVVSYSTPSGLLVPAGEQVNRISAWDTYWDDDRIIGLKSEVDAAAVDYGMRPEMFQPFWNVIKAEYKPDPLYESGLIPDNLMSNLVEKVDDRYLVMTSAVVVPEFRTEVNKAVDEIPGSLVTDSYYYTGELIEMVSEDFNKVLGISSIFVFIVLLLSFRSVAVSLVAFMPMFLSWHVVRGVMGLFGLDFNLISIVIASLIFGVGVDYSIFSIKGMISRYSGKDNALLLEHKTAISLSAFILIFVLGSLLFASHPAIKSIGLTTLIGMTTTILLTYVIQPVLFRLVMKNKRLREYVIHREK